MAAFFLRHVAAHSRRGGVCCILNILLIHSGTSIQSFNDWIRHEDNFHQHTETHNKGAR